MNPPESTHSDHFVVGVGASAGGIEALSSFFAALPDDINAALLVITHLGPHRESKLSDILARFTRLSVSNAVDGEEIKARHVYVLPADSIMTIEHRRLALRPVSPEHRERNPIDICFASLAAEFREASIGVVLSGSGVDGTLGVKVIKEEGGFTIAQAKQGAAPQHGGMPNSATGSGYIDVSVPVEQIGSKLAEYVRRAGTLNELVADRDDQTVADQRRQVMAEIYEVLRKRVGHDFEHYKEKTFVRRVMRRMQVLQLATLTDYSAHLRAKGEEASHLFRDLLIGVTSFFRDTEAFDAIAKHVIPNLFENAGAADTVRVWVPGCATGEEAYSIAILLREHMATLKIVPRVQVFATDIDESALAAARAGRYPAALLDGMPKDRIDRFFRSEPATFVAAKELRELCIFSSHSVIRDPPFSRMDFVSCRNLLIYFNAELQDHVLPVIHYALKSRGFLFLGPSENVSRHTDLFAAVDKKHRIYQRRPAVGPNVRVPIWATKTRNTVQTSTGPESSMQRDQQLRALIQSKVMDTFAPAHIVVDGQGDILFYSARTGKYLEPQAGSPSRQLLAMARHGLRLELRSALREATEKLRQIVRERLEIEIDDRIQPLRLTIEPLATGVADPLYLVVFTDLGPSISREQAVFARPVTTSSDQGHLEQELGETRDRLQATIEEYETALEELKSGNEELVSVNEELQSTNEELETSKEELQSLNEELHTVNAELAERVDDLHRANADMRNLFDSSDLATVFLDRQMLIRSYTPAVTTIFNLIASDCGRPITDIVHKLESVDLATEIQQVITRRSPSERPVQQRDSKVYYLMRILPYRTTDNEVDGALITFVNVSAMIAAEEQHRVLVAELNHRVRNMLQVVMGLANQTLHRAESLKQFGESFFGRMQALARAYELLSRDGWHQVPVAELVRTQLSAFATEGQRYSAEGELLVLKANAALSLGMVLYELATNATKYGALSVPSGHVAVHWRLERRSPEQQDFILCWKEHGGPTVKPPTRQGFGSELVQKQLKYELSGTARMEFMESGLVVTLAIPVEEAIEQQDQLGAQQ